MVVDTDGLIIVIPRITQNFSAFRAPGAWKSFRFIMARLAAIVPIES
jgi:hypothetical protein